jgi:hypothetical protein
MAVDNTHHKVGTHMLSFLLSPLCTILMNLLYNPLLNFFLSSYSTHPKGISPPIFLHMCYDPSFY